MTAAAHICTTPLTAMLIVHSRSGPVLCPFFARCDGVLLVDEVRKSTEFHQHSGADAKSLCELILALHPRKLVCGFIGEVEKQRLRQAGIDVRTGSCSCSIGELVDGFGSLPRA